MEITKNKTVNFILVNVALPIVLSLVVAFTFDHLKAKKEMKKKTASQSPQKEKEIVQETVEEEVATEA